MKIKFALAAVALTALINANAKAEGILPAPIADTVTEAVTPAPTAYKTGCYAFGSVGVGITEANAAGVTFSDQGATYGLGAGCDIVTGSLLIGALGNVDFTNQSFAGTSVDPSFQIGARAGVLISSHVLAYATGGWALTDIDTDYSGYFIGGGLEVLVNRHLFIGGEYTASLYAAEGGVEPTGHAVRVKAGWRF